MENNITMDFVSKYCQAQKRGQETFLYNGKPYAMTYAKILVDKYYRECYLEKRIK